MERMEGQQKMLSVYDLMEYLHIGQTNAYALVHTPGFPAVKITAQRYVIPVDLLDKWLAERAGKVGEE